MTVTWIGIAVLIVGTIMTNGEGRRSFISQACTGIGGLMAGIDRLIAAFGSSISAANLIIGLFFLILGGFCLVLVLMDIPYLSHPATVHLNNLTGGRSSASEGVGYTLEGRKDSGTVKSFRISKKTYQEMTAEKRKGADVVYLPHTDTVLSIQYN